MKNTKKQFGRVNKVWGWQKFLAGRIGVSESLISRVLSGRRRPTLNVVERLSTAIGVTVDELLRELKKVENNSK